MGFWDEYKENDGGKYLTGADKTALIASRTPLQVTSIRREESPFKQKDAQGNATVSVDRFVLDVELNGEARRLSYDAGSVESRDRLFSDMIRYVEEQGDDAELPKIVIERKGNSPTAAQLVKLYREDAPSSF